MREKILMYCTYHSCYVSEHMAKKHDCIHKSLTGNVRPCKYLINVLDRGGNKTEEKRVCNTVKGGA